MINTSPSTHARRGPARAHAGRDQACGGHHRQRHRDQAHRCHQRGVAADQLQVLQHQEHEAEEREELQADRHGPRGEGPMGEQARIEQRVGTGEFPAEEPGQHDHPARDATVGAPTAPPLRGCLDDRVDQHAESGNGEHRTE